MKKILLGFISVLFILSIGYALRNEIEYVEALDETITIKNTEDFLVQMAKSGYEYEVELKDKKGLLNGDTTLIDINGEHIQIYNYKDKDEVKKDMDTISKDGNMVGNVIYEWVLPPHLYKNQNLIVLYNGDNKKLRANIEKILGMQFAGWN